MRKRVAISDTGRRLGEDNPRAKLTNNEVERIRDLHEDGWSYKRLAEVFEVSKSMIQAICQFKRRAESAKSWRTVHTSAD